MGAHVRLGQRRRTRTTSPSFVRSGLGSTTTRGNETRIVRSSMYRQSYSRFFRFVALCSWEGGNTHKRFQIVPVPLSFASSPPPGHPLEKPQQIKEREKEDRLLAAFGQCYYYYIVSLSMRVGDGRRDCLLHDSIAIHARGPQSLSADDVKVE